MTKQEVLRHHPRAKCICNEGIYMVVAWDMFFVVGPLLGQGRSADEAWGNVRIPIKVTPEMALAVLHGGQYFRKHRSKCKGRA